MSPSLAHDLASIVGQRHVREARAERMTYSMDGLPTHRRVPDIVVLPGSREELIAVVRLLAALEVLLADGSLVEIGSPGGEPWGPDLVGVFVGSEGNFGIATRITVRLTPLPRAVRTLLADFTGLRVAGEAVSAIIGAGIVPAALEMMDQSCINAVEDSVYAAGYPRDAAAVLLVEIDGRNADAVVAETEVVVDLLRQSGARSVRSAASEAERERLWQGRKKAFGAMGRLSRDLVVQDAVVPRSALPHVLDTVATIAKHYGLA